MTAAGFVVAGYGVILGGIAIYVGLLLRRLRVAREALRRETDAAPLESPR